MNATVLQSSQNLSEGKTKGPFWNILEIFMFC